jgi:predicted ATPase
MLKLNRPPLSGDQSLCQADFECGSMSVRIRADHAGKSSFVAFFRPLNEMMGGRLHQFVGEHARPHPLLFQGPNRTPQQEASREFEADAGLNACSMRLSPLSSTFLDNFEPENGLVVDRRNNGSVSSRPDPETLSVWREEYSPGEVWEKNVLAAVPNYCRSSICDAAVMTGEQR